MKTKLSCLIVFLLSLPVLACSFEFGVLPTPTPIAPAVKVIPAGEALSPTTTPEVFLPATAVAPKGPMISGLVLWGSTPVAGAWVELSTGVWVDSTANPVIAKTVADENGAYQLEAPPAGGDFGLVAVWPDGGTNGAPVTPVQISAGAILTGVNAYLAKELKVLEPAAGASVGPTPVLQWQGRPEVAKYRVWVIDAGTTQAMLDQVTTDTRLAVGVPLLANRDYRWVVNGLASDDRLLATLTGEFKVAAQAAAGTELCQAEGLTTYASATDGYCFGYPPSFELKMSELGQPVIYGPALDKSPDPLRAALTLEVEVAARDKTLAQIVDGYVSQFDGMPVPPINRTSFTLSGEAAVMLEVVPGREGSRDIFALHNGALFHLMFMPSVRDFSAAKADVEALYQAVIQSWNFDRRSSASGAPVSFDRLSLDVPAGVASGGSGTVVAEVAGENAWPWDVAPAHLQFTLDGYALQGKLHQPRIYVYPAEAYGQVRESAALSLKRLRGVLARNSGARQSKEELPFVPFFNATQIIASNVEVIPFQNGRGVRVVTQYAQGLVPINNHELIYHFEGLTDDGRYYVIAILPVSALGLAEDANVGGRIPAGGVPLPDLNTANPDMHGYYVKVQQVLDGLEPGAFAPGLDQLDVLIGSLRVTTAP